MKVGGDPWYNLTMTDPTDPQASALLKPCNSDEMRGERIVSTRCGHPAHEQYNLAGGTVRNPYASLTYTMASGKVFVLTASMGEINCYRSSVDAPPVVEPKRDAKREANWVLKLGTQNGEAVYLADPRRNQRTKDLDKAHGWVYKKDAEAERADYFRDSMSRLGLDPCPVGLPEAAPAVGRRSSFRQ